MTRRCVILLIITFLILPSLRMCASPQLPNYIIFRGDTIATYNLILELYFQNQGTTDHGKLFGLSFRDGASLNCWRGYQAIYKFDNDTLFLADIISCGERRSGKIDKAASAQKMKTIFNDRFINGKVYMDWFSGDMSFPLNNQNNKVLRWDGVFYTIFEKETVISITNGKILNIADVDNYEDNPKAIDRKDKSKLSDILFNQIKKARWKNTDKFDCSDKYLVIAAAKVVLP